MLDRRGLHQKVFRLAIPPPQRGHLIADTMLAPEPRNAVLWRCWVESTY